MRRWIAFAFMTAVGCGPVVATQRFALLPEKPESCIVEQLKSAPLGDPAFTLVGTVSLVRRKIQSSVELTEDNLRLVRQGACKIGGDAFAFSAQSPSGIDFAVFQKNRQQAAN